jgi:hypothetical protein
MQTRLSEMLRQPGQGFGAPPAQNRFMQNEPSQITQSSIMQSEAAKPSINSPAGYMQQQRDLLEYVKRTGDTNFPEYQDWVKWTLGQLPTRGGMTQAQIENYKDYLNKQVLELGGSYGIKETPEAGQKRREQEMREKIREEMRQQEIRMREADEMERRRKEEENIRRRMRGMPSIEQEEQEAKRKEEEAEALAQYQKNMANHNRILSDFRQRNQQVFSKTRNVPGMIRSAM